MGRFPCRPLFLTAFAETLALVGVAEPRLSSKSAVLLIGDRAPLPEVAETGRRLHQCSACLDVDPIEGSAFFSRKARAVHGRFVEAAASRRFIRVWRLLRDLARNPNEPGGSPRPVVVHEARFGLGDLFSERCSPAGWAPPLWIFVANSAKCGSIIKGD